MKVKKCISGHWIVYNSEIVVSEKSWFRAFRRFLWMKITRKLFIFLNWLNKGFTCVTGIEVKKIPIE